MSSISAFDRTEQKTMRWMQDVAERTGAADMEQSYTMLRAVLHTLRDRLMPDEAVHLGAQLPMLIPGFYYEGWNPHRGPRRYRHKAEFIQEVRNEAPALDDVQAERASTAVFDTLEKEMPGGELYHVRQSLPDEVRDLWPERAAPGQ